MRNFVFSEITAIIIIGLSFHQVSCQFVNNYIEQNVNITGLLFKDFAWTQCGTPDVIKFSRLEIDPDPMKIPGILSVGLDVLVKSNLTSPLPFTLKMKKKVFGVWVDIPCEHGFGSCQYSDFCTLWPYPKPCPDIYTQYGVPCSCPFPANRYNFPEVVVGNATLPFSDIPKWLENGHYSIEAHLMNQSSEELFCIQILMQMKINN